MRLFKIDGREIRSFKLQQQILTLRQFFDKPNSFGVFMMNDLLQPEDRMIKRPVYNSHHLKIQKLPKKVGSYLTQHKNWAIVSKLLSGNVFLIQNNNSKELLSRQTLNFLINNEKYALRFLFWNQSFYRSQALTNMLKLSSTEDFKADLKLSYQILRLSAVLTSRKNNIFFVKSFEARSSKVREVAQTSLTKSESFNTFLF